MSVLSMVLKQSLLSFTAIQHFQELFGQELLMVKNVLMHKLHGQKRKEEEEGSNFILFPLPTKGSQLTWLLIHTGPTTLRINFPGAVQKRGNPGRLEILAETSHISCTESKF